MKRSHDEATSPITSHSVSIKHSASSSLGNATSHSTSSHSPINSLPKRPRTSPPITSSIPSTLPSLPHNPMLPPIPPPTIQYQAQSNPRASVEIPYEPSAGMYTGEAAQMNGSVGQVANGSGNGSGLDGSAQQPQQHYNPPTYPTHNPHPAYPNLNVNMSHMNLHAGHPNNGSAGGISTSPYTPTPTSASTGIITPLTGHPNHNHQQHHNLQHQQHQHNLPHTHNGYGSPQMVGMPGYGINMAMMSPVLANGIPNNGGGGNSMSGITPAHGGHMGMMGYAPPYGYIMGGGQTMRPAGGMGMGSPPMGMNKMLSPRIGTLPNGNMDPAQMTGNYGPAAAAAAAAAAGNTTGRTVYVGNLPPEASVDELMNLVRFGPVESVRVLPEKSCVFISFLDGATSAAFHADATVKKLTLHGQELKIGWGKPSVVPAAVVQAIAMSKATRNVYLGGLDETHTESTLRDDLSRFGPIDLVKIVRDKGIGFVHFLSILAAMRVVATLSTETGWKERRIGYGKDRCAYVPRAQQAAVQAAQAQAAAAIGRTLGLPGAPFHALIPHSPAALYGAHFGSPAFAQNGFGSGVSIGMKGVNPSGGPVWNGADPGPNRCVYIGNIPEGATTEEVCNVVKGGLLQQVKYMPEKRIAFITFVKPEAAAAFHSSANTLGLGLGEIRLKIGWGKNSLPVPSVLQRNIEEDGATRNVYLGNIHKPEVFTLEKLTADFEPFGEIEHINFLPEKKIGFVNFCSIQQAVRALEATKLNPEYQEIKLSYGKDRCANQPGPKHFGVPIPKTAGRGDTGRSTSIRAPTSLPANPVTAAIAAAAAERIDADLEPTTGSTGGSESGEVPLEEVPR